MKKIANACWRSRGEMWGSFHYVPEGREFLNEVVRSPCIGNYDDPDEITAHNTVVAIAQHVSSATWVHRSDKLINNDISATKDVLARMLRMYHTGDLTGDALFYKTTSQQNHIDAQYPITFKEDSGTEYWFITGLVDWFPKLNHFVDGDMNRSYNVADIPIPIMIDKLRDMNLAETDFMRISSSGSARNKLWLRANWLSLIKDTLNYDFHNQFAVYMGTRFGYAMYKNGRAYMHQFGTRQFNHIVDVHPRRNIVFNRDARANYPVQFRTLTYDPIEGIDAHEDRDGLERLHLYFKGNIIPQDSPIDNSR